MGFTFTAPFQQPRKCISRSRRRSSDHENAFHVHSAVPATTKMGFTFTAPLQRPRKCISRSRRRSSSNKRHLSVQKDTKSSIPLKNFFKKTRQSASSSTYDYKHA